MIENSSLNSSKKNMCIFLTCHYKDGVNINTKLNMMQTDSTVLRCSGLHKCKPLVEQVKSQIKARSTRDLSVGI